MKTLNLYTYMKHTFLNEISTMESRCSLASQRRERFWREFTIFEPRTTRWPSIAIKVIGILQFLGSWAIVEQFTNFITMCAIWQGVTERRHWMSSAGKQVNDVHIEDLPKLITSTRWYITKLFDYHIAQLYVQHSARWKRGWAPLHNAQQQQQKDEPSTRINIVHGCTDLAQLQTHQQPSTYRAGDKLKTRLLVANQWHWEMAT